MRPQNDQKYGRHYFVPVVLDFRSAESGWRVRGRQAVKGDGDKRRACNGLRYRRNSRWQRQLDRYRQRGDQAGEELAQVQAVRLCRRCREKQTQCSEPGNIGLVERRAAGKLNATGRVGFVGQCLACLHPCVPRQLRREQQPRQPGREQAGALQWMRVAGIFHGMRKKFQ